MKEIEAFVNAANEQELEAAWNNFLGRGNSADFESSSWRKNHPKMHWHFQHSCMMMP